MAPGSPALARRPAPGIPGHSWRPCGRLALVLVLAWPLAASAQPAADGAAWWDGRVAVGGEVTASVAPNDEGFFNYTDYRHSTLRLFTATLSGSLRITSRVAALGEVRVENDDTIAASAFYVRVRPWAGRALDIQAGRIPPVFGAFARRRYGSDNPLIGTPLAYQYVTTLRRDVVPVGADALLAVRGRGWRVGYPAWHGAAGFDVGLPLVSASRWDTGVQVRAGDAGRIEAAAALTLGSLSSPLVKDDNGGRQIAGRLTWQPAPPIRLGASAAHGAFLGRTATDGLPDAAAGRSYPQRAIGLDAELSAGYWIVRGEVLVSTWRVPAIGAPPITDPLRATAVTVEGRYRLRPGWHVAARAETLTFSPLRGALHGGRSFPWDANVSRIEIGTGHAFSRHLLAKLAWQYNWREGVARPRPREGFVAAQLSAWF